MFAQLTAHLVSLSWPTSQPITAQTGRTDQWRPGQGLHIGVTDLPGPREYDHPEVGHYQARLLIRDPILGDIIANWGHLVITSDNK